MNLVLGSLIKTKGCLTRLIDVVNRDPVTLEDLIGFNRGRLGQGFYVLLLTEPLAPLDFAFFGYTYMSGGKLGLPDNDKAIENARVTVDDSLVNVVGAAGASELRKNFAKAVPLSGPDRYVKIIPLIDHDSNLGAADQYPSSRFGIKQLNLLVKKSFLVAARVSATTWDLANNTSFNVAERPRYDLPYANDPRKKTLDYLAKA